MPGWERSVPALCRNHALLEARSKIPFRLKRIAVRNLEKPRETVVPRELLTDDWQDLVNDPEIDIIIELIGGTRQAYDLVTLALRAGKPVVTGNKALLAEYGAEIFKLSAEMGTPIYFEASAGGGIPIIQSLQNSLICNHINSIVGIINGTSNYILSAMGEHGADYADALAQAQKLGGEVAFIDVEHALDPTYARALGVDIDSLLVSQPDTGEQAMEICEALVRSGAIDAIVVDSVAAMVPKAEIEGEMGDSHVGLQARLMSQALRKLTGIIGKTNTVCIFINQLREKVGVMYGNPEVTTGGRALKYYSSVRIDVRRIEGLKDASGSFIGNRTRAKIVKNKVAPPFREAEFDIMFGEGISKLGEMIDLGAKLGIVQKSGAWFNYGDIRLGQGRDNAKLYLKEHPDVAAEIEKQVRENADRLLAAGKKGTVKPLEKPAVTPVAAEDAPAAPMADAPKTTGSEMDLDIMVDE